MPNQQQVRTQDVAVAAGGSVSVYNIPAGSTIAVAPGASGTMTAQVRVSPNGALIATSLNASAAAAMTTLTGPVFEVIFSAATAAGVGSICTCQ